MDTAQPLLFTQSLHENMCALGASQNSFHYRHVVTLKSCSIIHPHGDGDSVQASRFGDEEDVDAACDTVEGCSTEN